MTNTAWTLLRKTAATDRPVTLDQVKQSLRLSLADVSHDADLARMIDAATEQWEQDSDGAVMLSTYVYSGYAFPSANGPIQLPNRPSDAITQIEYLDENGDSQTLDVSWYALDSGRRQVYLNPGFDWPATYHSNQLAVNVTYDVGYATAVEVPREIQQAIILQVGKWFADPMMETADAFAHDEAYERLARRNFRTSYP